MAKKRRNAGPGGTSPLTRGGGNTNDLRSEMMKRAMELMAAPSVAVKSRKPKARDKTTPSFKEFSKDFGFGVESESI